MLKSPYKPFKIIQICSNQMAFEHWFRIPYLEGTTLSVSWAKGGSDGDLKLIISND